jgi:hypothetical protein
MSNHTEKINGIVADLEVCHREAAALLKSATDEVATRTPADGGWNAAQTGYHIGIANSRLASSTLQNAADPPPDFVENKDIFKGIPPKVKTFEALEPGSEVNKGSAIEQLDKGFADAVRAFRSLTEEQASRIVTFPFGAMTLYQLGEFVVLHARRHIEQMRRALG